MGARLRGKGRRERSGRKKSRREGDEHGGRIMYRLRGEGKELELCV